DGGLASWIDQDVDIDVDEDVGGDQKQVDDGERPSPVFVAKWYDHETSSFPVLRVRHVSCDPGRHDGIRAACNARCGPPIAARLPAHGPRLGHWAAGAARTFPVVAC